MKCSVELNAFLSLFHKQRQIKPFEVLPSFDDGEETQMGFHILIYPPKLLKAE